MWWLKTCSIWLLVWFDDREAKLTQLTHSQWSIYTHGPLYLVHLACTESVLFWAPLSFFLFFVAQHWQGCTWKRLAVAFCWFCWLSPAWWQSNKCATLDWDQRTVKVHLNTAVIKKAVWEDLNQMTRPSILLEDVIRGWLHWGDREKDIVRINWGRQLVPTGPESAKHHCLFDAWRPWRTPWSHTVVLSPDRSTLSGTSGGC